ncbi:MAG: hypothetical protein IKU17_02845, partial [Clostridia bacterium]|nr:hypothetical protein [Clostridia bacterium]
RPGKPGCFSLKKRPKSPKIGFFQGGFGAVLRPKMGFWAAFAAFCWFFCHRREGERPLGCAFCPQKVHFAPQIDEKKAKNA